MQRIGHRHPSCWIGAHADVETASLPVRAMLGVYVDEIVLVGPVERIRDRLQAWHHTSVTMLLIMSRDLSPVRPRGARFPESEGAKDALV